MQDARRRASKLPRGGCAVLGAGLFLVTLVALGLSGIAHWQNRTLRPETERFDYDPPGRGGEATAGSGSAVLRLDVSTATVTLQPGPPGSAIDVEAWYDPRRFKLRQEQRQRGDDFLYRVSLRPSGTEAMALMRAKLGGDLPTLRIRVPPDVRLSLEGEMTRSFVAIELGGLSVEAMRLDINQGSVHLSCNEPLQGPMRQLTIHGRKGSLIVGNLGNASPRRVSLAQRVGTVDLDLRGPWSNDATIDVTGRFVGGSLWLPRDVRVDGLPDGPRGLSLEDSELPPPRLHLSIHDRVGKIVILE